MITRVRFTITGRVQMVGFRYFTIHQARDLGITGYVRNLPDGSVEVVAHGEEFAVEVLSLRLRQGPPSARVDWVFRDELDPAGETFRNFFVR